MRAPRSYPKKDDVPRWSFGLFRDHYRCGDAFVSTIGMAYDLDAEATVDSINSAFGDLCGFAHTTWSEGRWRVAILLSRPVNREEHERVWRAGAAHAERAGALDYGAKDCSRAWALPAQRPHYQHVELTGALLDVEQALATFPHREPERLPPSPRHNNGSNTYAKRLERAGRYLAAMPGAIAGSHGHATTFRAAIALVRGFALEPDDALALLVEVHNPLCQPRWSLPELRHKVKQAFQRARVPFGAIADRSRA